VDVETRRRQLRGQPGRNAVARVRPKAAPGDASASQGPGCASLTWATLATAAPQNHPGMVHAQGIGIRWQDDLRRPRGGFGMPPMRIAPRVTLNGRSKRQCSPASRCSEGWRRLGRPCRRGIPLRSRSISASALNQRGAGSSFRVLVAENENPAARVTTSSVARVRPTAAPGECVSVSGPGCASLTRATGTYPGDYDWKDA
jgi:hypothetical protein